jgi:DNA-binding NarL/FixJ family response regulator
MDLIMPMMDGFVMYENIKKANLAPDAIAIMLTNQGQTSDINRAKDLGIHGYIVKATTIPSEVVEEVINIYNKNKK